MNLTADQASNQSLPALCYFHEYTPISDELCLEGESLTFLQLIMLLVEKAGVAPDITFRFTVRYQVSMQLIEPLWF